MKTLQPLPYLAAVLVAVLFAGCSDNNVNPQTQSSDDRAAITGSLASASEFVNDSYFDTNVQTNLSRGTHAAPGAAIQPFLFWRSITGRDRAFEFAFSDSDSTNRPTTAIVTLHRTFTGTFNIVPRSESNPNLPDFGNVIHKPLEDHWVRRYLVKRVAPSPGASPVWRLAAASAIEVTSKNATSLITSVRVETATKDTTLADPMEFIRLRSALRFSSAESVTVTVTTPRNDDVVLLYHHGGRARFTSHGDGTYTAKFWAGSFSGWRHFGVNVLSHGTVYDDTAAYDSKAWIFPYVLVNGPYVDYWP